MDVFPPQYVIFLEFTDEQGRKTNNQQLQILQNNTDAEVEQQLWKADNVYQYIRNTGKLGPLVSVLVRSETFSTFRHKMLMTDRMSLLRFKPHRMLKNDDNVHRVY